jgi:hypothetical protein
MSVFRSFHVDGRISIKLEYDFAMKLAEFILNSGTGDKKILALAHKLSNLDEEDGESSYNRAYENPVYNRDLNKIPETIYPNKEGMYAKEQPIDAINSWEAKRSPIRLKRSSQMRYGRDTADDTGIPR